MKLNLSPFDSIIADELAKRRNQSIDEIVSNLLRFEACSELVNHGSTARRDNKLMTQNTVIYAQTNTPQPA